MITVKSRVHRTIRTLARYYSWEPTSSNLELIRGIRLRDEEKIIGFYRNDLNSNAGLLVITNVGIHIRRDQTWEVIDYDHIAEVLTPPSKKDVFSLTVQDKRGRLIELPVTGARGRFYDAFEMLRFLMRVMGDINAKDS